MKTLLSNAGGAGSIPDGGAKTPQSSWPQSQNINKIEGILEQIQ